MLDLLGQVAGGELGVEHLLALLLQGRAFRRVRGQPQITAEAAVDHHGPVVVFDGATIGELQLFPGHGLLGPARLGAASGEAVGVGEQVLDAAHHRGGGGPHQLSEILDAEQDAEAPADVRDPALLIGDHDGGDRRADQAVEPLGLVGQRAEGELDLGDVSQEPGKNDLLADGHLHRRQLHGPLGAVRAPDGDAHLAGELFRVTGGHKGLQVLVEPRQVPLRNHDL